MKINKKLITVSLVATLIVILFGGLNTVNAAPIATTTPIATGTTASNSVTIQDKSKQNTFKIDSINTSRVSPQVVGKNIKISADVQGQGELKYRFIILHDKSCVYSTSYSSKKSINWTPSSTGIYTIYFKVKDDSGNEVVKNIKYEVLPKALKISSLNVSKEYVRLTGFKIKIDAKAEGGQGSIGYKFNIIKDGKNLYKSDFSSNNTASFTLDEEGKYEIYCKAKDENGKQVKKSIEYTVLKANAQDIINEAYKYLGVPYKWGGNTPDGFDSSGYTQYVFKTATGIDIGRTTYDQINSGKEVSYAELQPGDLIFPHSGHVGIYIGNGMMVHVQQTGETVKIGPVYRFWRARRIIG